MMHEGKTPEQILVCNLFDYYELSGIKSFPRILSLYEHFCGLTIKGAAVSLDVLPSTYYSWRSGRSVPGRLSYKIILEKISQRFDSGTS